MTMYDEICTEIMHQEEAGADFDDLRLSIHPDRLSDLMIEMGANSALLDCSKGRPERFGHVPITESLAQDGWAIIAADSVNSPDLSNVGAIIERFASENCAK